MHMSIIKFRADGFRNLKRIHIKTSPYFNFFYGQNGAGKTSILEAFYYLGMGKSFRSHLSNRIIQHQMDCFSIFLHLQQQQTTIPIGIERYKNGTRRIKINGEPTTSIATLAKLLPIQLLSTESYRYFYDGSKPRRQFLDWGLFHVKPGFFTLWQSLQQALKQRNACLRMQVSNQEIQAWDEQIAKDAEKIDRMRQEYVEELHPILTELFHLLLPETQLELRYSRGWTKDQSLLACLQKHLHRDRQLGYTQYGPHRADLQLHTEKAPAHDHLSQGQQKLASYALRLAQGVLLKQETQVSPIYLIDDLASELDRSKQHLLFGVLAQLEAQVFLTSINLDDLDESTQAAKQTNVFHVKRGQIEIQSSSHELNLSS